jgi:putative solute:sodium symporter small subunit
MPTEPIPTEPMPSADHDPAAHNPAARRLRVQAARTVHWTRTRRITALLLTLWLATGFCTVFFARDLAHLSVFGWPLSFYLAAQGASLIFLTIIGVYAWRMRAFDRAFAHDLARLLKEDA